MRFIRNLCWLIVGLLLGAVITLAHAADGTDAGVPGYQYTPSLWNTIDQSAYYATREVACTTRWGGTTVVALVSNSYRCKTASGTELSTLNQQCANGTVRAGSAPDYQCRSNTQSCPTGSTLSGGKCTCNSGLVFYDGACKAPVCNSSTPITGSTYGPDMSAAPYEACINGCKSTIMDKGMSKSDCKVINGVKVCKIDYRYRPGDGGSSDRCTAGAGNSQPPDNSATPESCGAGQGMIKVDGTTRCINTSTGQEVSTKPPTTETTTQGKTTVTDPATGKTTVTNTITNVTTGGTTTITNVYGNGVDPNAVGAVPISTTTTTTGGGATGSGSGSGSGTGTGTNDGQTDCDKHPNSLACEDMGTPTQTNNVAKPTLYERKYPDGMAGVWTEKRSQMMNGPFGQLITKFTTVPQLGSAACPSFSFPQYAFAGIQLGGDISPPCWIWTVIKSIFILTALFAARALIFGG